MRTFEYARAATVHAATQQLAEASAPDRERDNAHTLATAGATPAPQNGRRVLAGGTDLLTLMKADIVAPSLLIDIKRAGDLPHGIQERQDGVALGALTTLSEIEHSALLQARYPALTQAVAAAATPQLRNMATIGGNLLQRPRCWYFRSSQFHCWLKGGEECHARDGENSHHAVFGESPCVAVHPSDAAAALMAYNGQVRLRGPAGERTLSLAAFLREPTKDRRTETALRQDELLLEIVLPAPVPGTQSVYLKAMDRKVWAFALVGVAAVVQLEGEKVADARIVLSGVAPVPWRAVDAEAALMGQKVNPDLIAAVAETAVAGAHPLDLNGYKLSLTKGLMRRALTQFAEQTITGGER
jgi:xanthine dehydrogenase YagS FAD-binding subunit